ncbi:MAG: N-acetylmuramic acid 6-phosphate etherase [Pirellulaceae bacterium]
MKNKQIPATDRDSTPQDSVQTDPGVTETRNPKSMSIDALSAREIAELMNREDTRVALAVERELNAIARVMESVADAFRAGRRLIYVGAGTSGRLGVLDASECPPTFHSDPTQVVGLIAGGHEALVRSIEGAEDNPDVGAEDLDKLSPQPGDVVIGIATSGRTPFVIGALARAKERGATTVALVCNDSTALKGQVDVLIQPVVGPEVVTGSTRLKAGTATKMVLNMITTGAMVLNGKTYENLMVDLRASNEKLRKRSQRIVSELTGLDANRAVDLLQHCDGELKTAIVCELGELEPAVARERLESVGGRLRDALTGLPSSGERLESS